MEMTTIKTSCGSPLQWDVYANGILVGYVRMRYGKASVFGYTFSESGLPEYRRIFHGTIDESDLLDDFIAADTFLDFAVELIKVNVPRK